MSNLLVGSGGQKIEYIYKPNSNPNSPLVILMHPHPKYGGNMHSKTLFYMEKAFLAHGFTTMRFNFRGVGRSCGHYDKGEGELMDASVCFDWAQEMNPRHSFICVAGFSFGAYIALQLMVRRTEINYFFSVSTPSSLFDISFIHPCPVDGVFIHPEKDEVSTLKMLNKHLKKVLKVKNNTVDLEVIPEANHYFDNHLTDLQKVMDKYIVKALQSHQ